MTVQGQTARARDDERDRALDVAALPPDLLERADGRRWEGASDALRDDPTDGSRPLDRVLASRLRLKLLN